MLPIQGEWKILPVRQHQSDTGNLGTFQFGDELDFVIKRIYYITEVGLEMSRGGHAHRNLKQALIAIGGELKVDLESASGSSTIFLKPLVEILLIEGLVWRNLHFESKSTVCLVAASEIYMEEDYVREYSVFKSMSGG